MKGRRARGMRCGRRVGWPLAVAVGLAFAPTTAQAAQEMDDVLPSPSVSAFAGTFTRTDFKGEGTGALFGFRARLPLSSRFVLAPGLSYTSFEVDPPPDDADTDLPFVLIDFQLRYQLPLDPVRPFAGVGAGGAVDFRADRGVSDFVVSTYTGTVGVSWEIGSRTEVTAGVQLRTLDGFEKTAAETSVGIGWIF